MPVLTQQAQRLAPTIYGFAGEGVEVDLTFLTPALAGDMDTLARPVTYLVFDLRSTDSKPRRARIYIDRATWRSIHPHRRRCGRGIVSGISK
jgi:hypothetical protein